MFTMKTANYHHQTEPLLCFSTEVAAALSVAAHTSEAIDRSSRLPPSNDARTSVRLLLEAAKNWEATKNR